MLSSTDILAPEVGVVSRESDGELVVVLPEQGRYLVLNGTGADVFRTVDGQRTLADIAAALDQRYDVPADRVSQDVMSFAEKLVDRVAVRLQGE